jgi:hypothetical protein
MFEEPPDILSIPSSYRNGTKNLHRWIEKPVRPENESEEIARDGFEPSIYGL